MQPLPPSPGPGPPHAPSALDALARPDLPSTASSSSLSSTRKAFLKALPSVQLPKKLLPFRARRSTLFLPADPAAPPLGLLVVRVVAATDLVARDRSGSSDPFCVIRCADQRVVGPTVDKCLNPVWGALDPADADAVPDHDGDRAGPDAGAAVHPGQSQQQHPTGESRLALLLWESPGLARTRVEVVLFDRDKIGKQYLGEVSLGLDEWWGDRQAWKGGVPPVGYMDPDNKPVWHPIRSTRRTSVHISGSLLVKVGFIPASATPTSSPAEKQLDDAQRAHILDVLRRLDEAKEGQRRASKEDMVLLASPTEGVGTQPISEVLPAGLTPLHDESSDDSDTSSLSSSTSASSDEEEEEEEYESEDPSSSALEVTASTSDSDPSEEDDDGDDDDLLVTAIEAPEGYFDFPLVSEPTALAPSSPSESPAPSPSLASAPKQKKGLSLPGFMRKSASSSLRSTPATSEVDLVAGTHTPRGGLGFGSARGGEKTKKKKARFSRKKTAASEGDIADGEGKGRRKKRKSKKKRRKEQTAPPSAGRRTTTLGRRGTKRDFKYEDDGEMFGLVQIEVKGASDLPKYKNMLKTGWDMDPFLVVSFGKKVFRTRVVRHSLNPVWDEKLFFPVRRAECGWVVAFNVYDWDKMSSNDHVGDVSLPLSDLIGTPLQPDERGLYRATAEGRLEGDEFVDHVLKVVVSDKEGTTASGGPPSLHIRAKFTPYAALRQQFLRRYARIYDIDESGTFTHLEVFSMLDSLGSTLSKETLTSFFTRSGKTDDQELTTDEVVSCLEAELRKSPSEKKPIDDGAESGGATPGLAFDGPDKAMTPLESSELSGTMSVLEQGREVLTSAERGTVVRQPGVPQHDSSGSSLDQVEETADGGVERVINIKECPLCHRPRMNSKAELDIVTHMGICSSTDPRSISRIVVGEYVTASQAQRKWFTKVISKATKGAYQLGADSANIIVQDRQTGMLQEEKMAVYVRLGIRLMYKGMGAGGGMEGARIRRMLESMSVKQGIKYDSPNSAREIAPFIQFHKLNMNETLDPVSSYKTFNEFFYRKLKPDARPIADPDDPRTAVSPADCRAMFFQTVDEATKIWIKGRDFSVSKLLGEGFKDKAPLYDGASLAIFRLAPQDYHRYHSPVDGVMGPQKKITGQYYTVNPMAIRSSIDIYGDNVRLVAPIISPVFGEVMNIWVGAMMVGSICMTVKEGEPVKRGQETGYFSFGGSTIVVLFPPKTVQFDADLLQNSGNSVETLVRMGSRIGRRV